MTPEEIRRKLLELFDNYTSVHERLKDIAQDVEMYGEVDEKQSLEIAYLKDDCEDIAYALNKILKGVGYAV